MAGKKRDLVLEASIAAKSLQLDEIKTISKAWLQFDLNGDGIVSTREVHNFLANLNINIPDSEKEHIEKVLDKNGNGTIEFIEFVIAYEKGLFKNLQSQQQKKF
jgi:Ca2+-binding EF-hand superfamily protein